VATLILLDITFESTALILVVDVIAAVIVEIVIEIKAMVARNTQLGTNTCTVARDVVIYRKRCCKIVIYDLRSVERILQLEEQIGCPHSAKYTILCHKARTQNKLILRLLVAVYLVGAEGCLQPLAQRQLKIAQINTALEVDIHAVTGLLPHTDTIVTAIDKNIVGTHLEVFADLVAHTQSSLEAIYCRKVIIKAQLQARLEREILNRLPLKGTFNTGTDIRAIFLA
jgi:hypothetical protein